MIDREKVVTALECLADGQTCACCDYKPYDDCGKRVARDAIDLLKEQEAVEPVVDIDTWKCGNCGHTLEHQELLDDNVLFHEQYNYCPGCGKAVSWKEK